MVHAATTAARERGLGYWMERVLVEADKARDGFQPDPVHDLRVAIRRCRSLADGFRELDPNPDWQRMRRAGKTLFSALGDLRDVQVLMEWVERLGEAEDPVRQKLMAYCAARESELKLSAEAAVNAFNAEQWRGWAHDLEERASRLGLGGPVFQVMALERWQEARNLHVAALRSRSKVAWHRLRIGIKKFRYVVENFLPDMHERWNKDLKHLQDALGEVHDLDVLTETARTQQVFATADERARWMTAIERERAVRVQAYREKMVGKESLWLKWRAELPQGDALRAAILSKFEIWADFLDPDIAHSRRVLQSSLKIYDRFAAEKLIRSAEFEGVNQRDLLTVAALTHEVGRGGKRKHHKQVRRMLQDFSVPPGWTLTHLLVCGLIARYHRGALPADSQKRYAALNRTAQKLVDTLAGVLRLADALDREHDGTVRPVRVERFDGLMRILAEGYDARSRAAERVAGARHLLETVCGVPIVVTTA